MPLFTCNPPPTGVITANMSMSGSINAVGQDRKDETFDLPPNLLICGWGISIIGYAVGAGTVGMVADLLIPQTGSTPASWYKPESVKNADSKPTHASIHRDALPIVDPSQAVHLGRLMKVISGGSAGVQRQDMEEISAKAEETVRRMPLGEAVLVLHRWGYTTADSYYLCATGSLYTERR